MEECGKGRMKSRKAEQIRPENIEKRASDTYGKETKRSSHSKSSGMHLSHQLMAKQKSCLEKKVHEFTHALQTSIRKFWNCSVITLQSLFWTNLRAFWPSNSSLSFFIISIAFMRAS